MQQQKLFDMDKINLLKSANYQLTDKDKKWLHDTKSNMLSIKNEVEKFHFCGAICSCKIIKIEIDLLMININSLLGETDE